MFHDFMTFVNLRAQRFLNIIMKTFKALPSNDDRNETSEKVVY